MEGSKEKAPMHWKPSGRVRHSCEVRPRHPWTSQHTWAVEGWWRCQSSLQDCTDHGGSPSFAGLMMAGWSENFSRARRRWHSSNSARGFTIVAGRMSMGFGLFPTFCTTREDCPSVLAGGVCIGEAEFCTSHCGVVVLDLARNLFNCDTAPFTFLVAITFAFFLLLPTSFFTVTFLL